MNRLLLIALLSAALAAPVLAAPAAPADPKAAPAAPAAPPAAAAPAAAPAAPAAPAAEKLAAVVKIVEGTVETRLAADQPWTPLKVGMALAEGADIRTGFRARCVVDLTESVVQVDALTVVRLGELRKEGGKAVTRLLLKQGNTQAAVVKREVRNDFAIVTPSATFSARGTDGIDAGYHPVFGGHYSLSQAGMMALINSFFQRWRDVRPGERTDDDGTAPIWFLAGFSLSPNIEGRAFDRNELWAALRWNTSAPFPTGLNGPSGPFISGGPQNLSPCVLSAQQSLFNKGGSIIDTGGTGSPYTPPFYETGSP